MRMDHDDNDHGDHYDNDKRRRAIGIYSLKHNYARRVRCIIFLTAVFVLYLIGESLSSSSSFLRGGGSATSPEVLLNLTATPLWRSFLEGDERWKKAKESNGTTSTSSITIVLTGDIHGHVMPSCTGNICYPGAPRISTVLQVIRRSTPNVLVLDAGDAGFENPDLAAKAMTYLNYTAMALGNHELDLGYDNVQVFLNHLHNIPVVAANLRGLPGVSSSVRVHLNNVDDAICIIGLTVQEFNPLAGPHVRIDDVKTSLRQALLREQRLLVPSSSNTTTTTPSKNSNMNCTKTIVLSHAGLKMDKQLASEFSSSQIDLFLGGHSHVISATGVTQPDSTEFGLLLLADSSSDARILHTGANGRFVGLIHLEWDAITKVTTHLQSEILPLDDEHGVESDKEMEHWLQEQIVNDPEEADGQLQPEVQINIKRKGGVCARICRREDCPLGQLVADAMRGCLQNGPCRIGEDTIPAIALLESGTLKGCLLSSDTSFGKVIPWSNKLIVLQLKGSVLKEFIQHGLDTRLNGQGGGFLQVAGIHYHYHENSLDSVLLNPRSIGQARSFVSHRLYLDPNQQPILESCQVQRHENNLRVEVDDSAVYNIIVTDWLAIGGDGYGSLVQKADAIHRTNVSIHDAITAHATTLPRITYGKSHQRSWSSDDELPVAKAAKSGISGFMGGAVAFWITFPLYTLFVRKSMGGTSPSHSHPFSSSWYRLWDGAGVGTFATATSDAVYFMVYSYSSLVVGGGVGKSSVAAVVNSVVTTPLWVIVTHKQLHNRSILSIAESVYRDKGLWGFFDSLPLNLMMCVYSVVRQVALEFLLGFVANVAIAATLASGVGTILTYPIQRLRIQLQSGEKPEGWNSFQLSTIYKGVDYRLMDICFKTFILFLVKEQSDVVLCIVDS
eukprot:scaffold1820_cov129-Cylindrotheca_fusiformis.AAC.13